MVVRGRVDRQATCFLRHPGTDLGVQIRQIAELTGGQEVALEVLHTRLDDPLLLRIGGWTRFDGARHWRRYCGHGGPCPRTWQWPHHPEDRYPAPATPVPALEPATKQASRGPSGAAVRSPDRNRPHASARAPVDTETSRISCAPPPISRACKTREASDRTDQFEMPVHGRNMPKASWPDYAENASNRLACLCRKPNGRNMPEGDTNRRTGLPGHRRLDPEVLHPEGLHFSVSYRTPVSAETSLMAAWAAVQRNGAASIRKPPTN